MAQESPFDVLYVSMRYFIRKRIDGGKYCSRQLVGDFFMKDAQTIEDFPSPEQRSISIGLAFNFLLRNKEVAYPSRFR